MAGRRLTFDLDADQVQAVVRGLDGSLTPVGFGRLHGGSTEVYRIDLAGPAEPLVLKIYRDDPAWAPAKEALVVGWFGKDLAFPTPRWLRLDESRTLLPLRYAPITWLPGENLRSLMTDPDIEAAYRQSGALLRRIHAIPMSAYGYVLGDGVFRPTPTNIDYMVPAFERAFRRFRKQGGDAELGRRLDDKAERRFDLLALSAGPGPLPRRLPTGQRPGRQVW